MAVHFEKVVAGFSRYHKYTLGTELRNKSREVVALIMKANAVRDKRPHLLHLRECLDELLIIMRIAKEARAFKSFKSFQYAVAHRALAAGQVTAHPRCNPTPRPGVLDQATWLRGSSSNFNGSHNSVYFIVNTIGYVCCGCFSSESRPTLYLSCVNQSDLL